MNATLARVPVEPFNLQGDTGNMGQRWKRWLERFENYVTAMGIKPTPEQVDLPFFHHETDNAENWCQQVESIKTEFEWSDLQLLVRLRRYLSDEAKNWYENWNNFNRTWASFKRDFVEAFPARQILGRLFNEAAALTSDSFNSYTTYVHQKLSLLKKLRASWSDSDLIELIVYGITDDKVRESAGMRNFDKISDLIAYVSTVPKVLVAIKPHASTNEPPAKRARIERYHSQGKPSKQEIKCFQCNQVGHVKRHCPNNTRTEIPKPAPTRDQKKDRLQCDFCFKPGHEESNCFTKRAIEKRKNTVNKA
ncbi:unnamed protein product [Brassicogethes aeneus]|uniref:CCHC-type domain-containing protein n=1 Tax=Brassicogethes aeneus TaxID=1431903 RepID=A0A9P0FMV6_BRAAE|nr:unnamed protein product [Brassicogethes aeneus]